MLALVLSACAAPAAPPADSGDAAATEAPAEEGEAEATEAPAEEGEAEAEGDAPTVALVYGVAGDGFYITMERGLREAAEAAGVNALADGPSQFDPVQQTPDPRRHGFTRRGCHLHCGH